MCKICKIQRNSLSIISCWIHATTENCMHGATWQWTYQNCRQKRRTGSGFVAVHKWNRRRKSVGRHLTRWGLQRRCHSLIWCYTCSDTEVLWGRLISTYWGIHVLQSAALRVGGFGDVSCLYGCSRDSSSCSRNTTSCSQVILSNAMTKEVQLVKVQSWAAITTWCTLQTGTSSVILVIITRYLSVEAAVLKSP